MSDRHNHREHSRLIAGAAVGLVVAVLSNLLASWLQQDVIHNIFTPEKVIAFIVITIMGLTIGLVLERNEIARDWKHLAKLASGIVGIIATLSLVTAISALIFSITSPPSPTPASPSFPSIDGMQCRSEGYHVHAHLSVYINGSKVIVPAKIGWRSGCLYNINTFKADGIIDVAQDKRKYTLGNFLEIWKATTPQGEYPPQLDGVTSWLAYANGVLITYDFHQTWLSSHMLITLVYHTSNGVPDTIYNWGPNSP